ncbi:MAG: hypothetical protein V4674_02440 [Patescibacteria group bacterium]
MKDRSKVGGKKGDPAYRTPSRVRVQNPQQVARNRGATNATRHRFGR